jgi:hypothetical protein
MAEVVQKVVSRIAVVTDLSCLLKVVHMEGHRVDFCVSHASLCIAYYIYHDE